MILTAEEYAKGIIDFDAVLPKGCSMSIWARTADQPGDDTEWTGPYSDPLGNKVLSPPKDFMQISIGLNRGKTRQKHLYFRKSGGNEAEQLIFGQVLMVSLVHLVHSVWGVIMVFPIE